MSHTVRVIAQLVALPGRQEELKSILADLVEPTRQEQGCLLYQLLQNQSDPNEFVFIEEWESQAMLEAHLISPHINQADAKLDGVLAAEPDIQLYRLLT